MTDLETLRAAVRAELVNLWTDLEAARREAIDGQWSIRCDRLAHRIKALTTLIGPAPWEEIPIPLLEDGIYQRIHTEMGIEAAVDMDRVAQVRASIEERLSRIRRSVRREQP